jgi:hypothetical protein
MNQQSKREKKSRTPSKAQVRDLKPKKDAKGGVTFTYGKPVVTYTPQKSD